ncbi:DNA alkylation repair protein [Runella slithyformis]|uniref:DNA alkylation repair enzyme n=1 Tax=Runella slithyformis (strain ATCC 29530 / DSM 19594 / LMG 11500 / NCIMB 11436 / LSU 4) TaxID=761193 RepID=A0A7U3ZJ77_RUNSL|nr:DNA alkylation repair protein [Runella slithyformis]AEI48200.1 DNA alkylation repair enzyme [Runella slithyformis DSM 19594]
MLQQLITDLKQPGSPEKAAFLSHFFKTGKGQYGEGDVFLGITMPEIREIVKQYPALSLEEWAELLQSPYHECRMAALIGLTKRFQKAKKDELTQQRIFDIYLSNLHQINNWDLVDVSCCDIVGAFLLHKDRSILYRLAERPHLWSQRVSIVSTRYFISRNQFIDTLQLSELLLSHKHDLIHKAIGWMLREVGKRDELVLEEFLDTHLKKMPRTALRYAIERFPESKRKYYLTL